MGTKTWAMGLVLISTVFTAFGQIFYKKASGGLALDLVALITNYSLYIGFLLYGIGALMLIISLKYGELSVLYPIYAMNFIWVSVLSPIFFDDSMNLLKWGGVLMVMVGVSLIGWGSRS